MSSLKHFWNDNSKKSDIVALSFTNELNPAEHLKSEQMAQKRKKWKDSFIRYGFSRQIGDKENLYLSGKSLFC